MSFEVGSEINIRIEVPNDDYVAPEGYTRNSMTMGEDGDGQTDMEWEASDAVEEVTSGSQVKQTEVDSSKESTFPLEDGECDSESSSDEDEDDEAFEKNAMDDSPLSTHSRRKGSLTSADFDQLVAPPRQYPNPYLTEEAQKRANRALRFQDCPFKIETPAEPLPKPTEKQLLDLFLNCGVITDDGGEITLEKVNPQVRQDAILIRGTQRLNTDEVFRYLYEQGLKPRSMEWVNDYECIVIYKDKYEAATSLLTATKPVAVDPFMLERKKSLLIDDKPTDEKEEQPDKNGASEEEEFDYDALDVIPHKAVKTPMPLGYVWRFGKPHPKSGGILLRYAVLADKKQTHAMKHSEFYKKYGNPNKPEMRHNSSGGRSSTSKKARVQEVPDSIPNGELQPVMTNKNAWTILSKNWSNEENPKKNVPLGEARARTPIPTTRHRPIGKRMNRPTGLIPENRWSHQSRDTDRDLREIFLPSKSKSMKERITRKRSYSDDEEFAEDGLSPSNMRQRLGTKTDRKQNDDDDDDNDDDEDRWCTRMSGPRMSMHADEEEERQKKRTKLHAVRRSRPRNDGIFSSGRLMPRRSVSDIIDEGDRRPVRERLGVKRVSTHFTFGDSRVPGRTESWQEEDEDCELDDDETVEEQDLRRLLSE